MIHVSADQARNINIATEKINSKYPYKIRIFIGQKGIFVKNSQISLFLGLIMPWFIYNCQSTKRKKSLLYKGFLRLTMIKNML